MPAPALEPGTEPEIRSAPASTPRSRFAWSEDLPRYDFGPAHPMAPVRLTLTKDLVDRLGLTDGPGAVVDVIDVADVDDDLLATVHDREYIAAVRAAESGVPDPARGLGTTDTPIFGEIHSASARIVGASVAAARSVWTTPVTHAVSVAGGMHHAMPGAAAGFCVYNDLAIAIRWLLDAGARRVAYVDLDAHHGDGVERAFWDDPRVLTVSVHESGRTLFPGTGYATDTGGAGAEGTAVNIPLPAGTRGPAWLRAVEAVVPPLVRAFEPDVIVSQHGADCHGSDPLTNLRISLDHQRAAAELVAGLAAECAEDRWLAAGGGGYTVVEVVPRAWAALTAVSAGVGVDPAAPTPALWRETVARLCRVPAPGDAR